MTKLTIDVELESAVGPRVVVHGLASECRDRTQADADQVEIEAVKSVDPLRPVAHVRANAVEVADDRVLSNLSRPLARALITTLLIQFGGFIWWFSSVESRLTVKEQRLARVEQRLDDDQRTISAIVERLARIEERSNAQLELLRRIDTLRHNGAEVPLLPDGDPVEEATVLVTGRGRHYPALAAAVGAQVGIIGGTYAADDESGDAHLFTRNLAALAANAGVRWRLETAVESLVRDGDALREVRRQLQLAELEYLSISRAAGATIAENYVGLPFEDS